MEANELRIDNWILKDGFPERVDLKTLEKIQNGSYSTFDGMPLTQELLLRLGFEFNTKVGVFKLPFTLEDQVGDFEFAGVPMSIAFISNGLFASGPIKYVHDLQNIYFSLTKQYLNFKYKTINESN